VFLCLHVLACVAGPEAGMLSLVVYTRNRTEVVGEEDGRFPGDIEHAQGYCEVEPGLCANMRSKELFLGGSLFGTYHKWFHENTVSPRF
jgi:hypothetical protein